MAANRGDALGPDLSLLRSVTCGLLKRQLESVCGRKPFDLIMDGLVKIVRETVKKHTRTSL